MARLTATGPFQLLPSLSAGERRVLEASILDKGVLVPVEYDEHGNILDGHHRVSICRKHGILDWPKSYRTGLTDIEKRTLVRELNVARRHLTTAQKRALIEQQLKDTPERSNRFVGSLLGVDHKTVSGRRAEMVREGKIPSLRSVWGADGVLQPARKQPIGDPWAGLKLRDGEALGNIRWAEVSAIIRANERDNALLRGILSYCEPEDADVRIRDAVPAAVFISWIERGVP